MKYFPLCFGWLLCCILTSCKDDTLFTLLPSSQTGIGFNNRIVESDSLNPLNEINIYNGGGVGIGDFNNDGLEDVYFTGNMVPNKLYLNKGKLRFQDVTAVSGADGAGRWCRGVSVVDINNDGKKDIYLSVSIDDDPRKRRNLLYVNQGGNEQGIPVFSEMAAEYGLDDDTHTTMTLFFDYDNDEDLDAYLVVNEHIPADNPSRFRPVKSNGSHPSTGRLYRNDWNESLGHGVFVNVSAQAGTTIEGYGHAGIITDINLDGWKDIYVTNDFLSNNLLYVNNGDGTFTDRSKEYFKQTSTFAMGVDMQDLNNDGLLDIVELDMNPQDNYRKKMMLGSNSYQTMQNFDRYGYQYQYSKNSVQLNQGFALKQEDSLGSPVFSQVGFYSGISETDWSWTPLVTDFDHDGYRDIIVTNGYPKDVTDHDFMVFRSKAALIATWEDILTQIPEVKLHNYGYKNKGEMRFDDNTAAWGLSTPSFSTGGAYADLDNDGDMDIVVNNINDEAFVYRNNASGRDGPPAHFLNVRFSGSSKNPGGYGAWIDIYYDNGKHQAYEHSPYRGYLSSLQDIAHFGLGTAASVDSLIVVWPNSGKQVLKNIKAGQVMVLDIADAAPRQPRTYEILATDALFKEVTGTVGMDYLHQDPDFVDFNIQKLLPHKLSEYAPALAVADLDGNGLEDLVCGGNSVQPAGIFYQRSNNRFDRKELYPVADVDDAAPDPYRSASGSTFKDEGILLFDADGDGDNDMYISRGGYEQKPGSPAYRDRFYVNDGKGNFSNDSTAIPVNFTSKSCVRSADFDRDGDLDIFVAGRVEPWNYPKPVSSMLLRNDSEQDKRKFTDVTATAAKDLVNAGMVCDALFSDFDNDGWPDLILAGEWMPVTFLRNQNGRFVNATVETGTADKTGWWNSIAPGDFDNDGDVDYIVGNLGLNSFFRASEKYPVRITAKDFDENGSYDAFPSVFLPVSHTDMTLQEFPVNQRDDVVKQVISMRVRYQNYKRYAFATMDSLFPAAQMKGAQRLSVNTLATAFFRNMGKGRFEISQLPAAAQLSLVNGIVIDDFDGDGNLDVAINGNDYGTDVSVGRYDAFNGLLMTGDGKGNFTPQTIQQSGIYIPGNGKAMVQLKNKQEKTLLAASQHNGPLKIFELKKNFRSLPVQPSDCSAVITYRNGKKQKRELYYGYSFLSQSGRTLSLTGNVGSVQITDTKGISRSIKL